MVQDKDIATRGLHGPKFLGSGPSHYLSKFLGPACFRPALDEARPGPQFRYQLLEAYAMCIKGYDKL